MVEIKDRYTHNIIWKLDANNFVNADLSEANLSQANLMDMDLSGANLSKANLFNANLSGAKLSGANLSGANVDFSDLIQVDLSQADLSGTTLNVTRIIESNLTDAKLTNANLTGTNLTDTNLTGTNFSGTILYDTLFIDCPTLSFATDLNLILHSRSSTLNTSTIRACINNVPDVFLEGIGHTREEINYLRSLYSGPKAIQFYSCFISHYGKEGSADAKFAERLRNDMLANNVSCWHFRYDLQMGDRWATQIESAIKMHDKLVVVCSEEGVFREGVIKEIIRAIEQETKNGIQKLFPVRLDGFILSKEARAKYDALPANLRRADWLDYMLEYQVGDFSKWKNHDQYQAQFQKLLSALKHPAER